MVSAREKTIGEVQVEIEAALARLSASPLPSGLEALAYLIPPRGMSARVSLCKVGAPREKIRSDARASSYWNPHTCKAVISFEADEQPVDWAMSQDLVRGTVQNGGPVEDLIKALDGAERDPRFREFVGLKSFRDFYLADRGFSWAADADSRRTAITTAIERQIVVTYSVPNPKHPNYPTTAIRLNREKADVREVLKAATAERAMFRPVPIRGEALSSTVLSERR